MVDLLELFKRYRIDGITQEDINNNITLNVHSNYGGAFIHTIKITDFVEWLDGCEKCINRDFYVVKKS